MDFQIGPTGIAWAALFLARPETPEEEAARVPLRCPACHRRDCVPSLPARPLDRVFLALHRVPYDCRVCGRRFRRFDREQAAQLVAAWKAAAF